MEQTSILITSFFIYSVIGWVWETIVCSVQEKKFVYRGFLNGPYCPIYGFGALAFIFFASPFSFSPITLFIAGTIIASVLEYVTSYILEKSFHTKWWDYSDHKYNLNGRIALIPSLFWGFLSVILIYFVNSPIQDFSQSVFNFANIWPSLIITAILIFDFISTVSGLISFRKLMSDLSKELSNYTDNLRLSIEDYLNFLSERNKKRLKYIERRTLKSFPKLSNTDFPEIKTAKSELLKADKALKKDKKANKSKSKISN